MNGQRIISLTIAGCRDYCYTVLDRHARLVCNSAVTATIVVVLFLVENPDREVENVDIVITCRTDGIHDVASLRRFIRCDDPVKIEFGSWREVAETLENVLSVPGRIRFVGVYVVLSIVDRVR